MKTFFKRLGSDVTKGMPVFVAGYIKRILEGKYDTLITKTEWGQKLLQLGLPEKYSAEVVINLLNAIADSELPEGSFLAKTLKEVLLDAGPEISKRIINGDEISEEVGKRAKNKIGQLVGLGKIEKPKERELASLMLELDNETLAGLLAWTYGIEEEERKRATGLIKNLSRGELAKFIGLSEESRRQMVELLTEKPGNKIGKETKGNMKSIFGATIACFKGIKELTADYLEGMKKLAVVVVLVILVLFLFSAVSLTLGISWPVKVSAVLFGLVTVVFLIAAVPILTAARATYENFGLLRRTVQLIAGFLFWILLLILYLWFVPIENVAADLPLVLVLFAAVALGFVKFGIGIKPKVAMALLFAVFLLTTVLFFLPSLRDVAGTLTERLNENIASSIGGPKQLDASQVKDFFETVEIAHEQIRKPRVWFCEKNGGGFELFDGPGFHKVTGKKLQSVTPEVVVQILEWQKSQQQPPEIKVPERSIEESRPMESQPVEPKPAEPGPDLPILSPTETKKEPALQQTEGRQGVQQEQQAQVPQTLQSSTESQHKIAIPRNTPISIRLSSNLSTDSNYSGQEFVAYLTGPLVAEGFVIGERNAEVKGVIVESKKAGRIKGVSLLSLKLTQMRAANGTRVNIVTNLLILEGKTSKSSDIAKILGGAAAGTAIGALVGGEKTAAQGAVAGAVAGTTTVVATRGKSLELPSETVLRFYLTEPIFLPR